VRNICVSKTAELIYSGLGDDYIDQKTAARNEYKSRLKKDIFKTDKNANGILEPFEERVRQGRLHR
jgi:hypothetical protein